MKCIYNGVLTDESDVRFPINDLALLRGYGIFDFFRLSEGVPLFMENHLDRFYKGAQRVRLPVPVQREPLKSLLLEMFRENHMPISGIRMILTGGTGNGAFAIGHPNLIVTQEPISFPTQQMYREGVKLITHEHLRDIPEVKTINYMTGIWLQNRVREQGAFDVLYTHNGCVHELTRSNLFIVTENNEIITPTEQVLKGVTRRQIIEEASSKWTVQERSCTMDELRTAREVFITGTTKRVLPISAVDHYTYHSANEGSVTRELMKLFGQIEQHYIGTNRF